MVEHELDKLLRRKFARKDDDTWEKLVGDKGPLSSLNTKIIAGYAFKIFDEKTEHDLHIIREIRNTFAHARKLLAFNDPLIANKLRSSKLMKPSDKVVLHLEAGAASAFKILCYQAIIKLMRRLNRQERASARRRLKESPIAQAFLGNLKLSNLGPKERIASVLLTPPRSHTENPSLATLPPTMGGLFGLSLDKLGKDKE